MGKIYFKAVFFLIGLNLLWVSQAWAVVVWPDNGNYYDFVPSNSAWNDAKTAAENTTYAGFFGHLVTITSGAENAFLNTNFNTGANSQFAWIGGWEPADDGVWKWAVGPEAGTQFSNFVNPTAPFNYANWGGIEPNDNKSLEDFAMFNIGASFASINPGQWADASPNPSNFDPVVGYLIEYESQKQTTGIPVPEPSSIFLMGLGLLLTVNRTPSGRTELIKGKSYTL